MACDVILESIDQIQVFVLFCCCFLSFAFSLVFRAYLLVLCLMPSHKCWIECCCISPFVDVWMRRLQAFCIICVCIWIAYALAIATRPMLISVCVFRYPCLHSFLHALSLFLALLRPIEEFSDVQISHLIFYDFFLVFCNERLFSFFQIRAQMFLSATKKSKHSLYVMHKTRDFVVVVVVVSTLSAISCHWNGFYW